MPMIFTGAMKDYTQTIAPADTTAVKSIAVAGTNGSQITSLNVTSTDTDPQTLAFYKTISAVNYLWFTVAIPARAGFNGATPTVDALRAGQINGIDFDINNNKVINISNGTTLSVSSLNTVGTAKLITVIASGGDF